MLAKIKSEIQSAIDEIREKEKYHASCIKENNKFVIMGLEIALDIIKRNEVVDEEQEDIALNET